MAMDLNVLRAELTERFQELNLTRVMMTAEGLLPAYDLGDPGALREYVQALSREISEAYQIMPDKIVVRDRDGRPVMWAWEEYRPPVLEAVCIALGKARSGGDKFDRLVKRHLRKEG